MAAPPRPPSTLALQRLARLPGGEQLLALAAERDDVELVGGAVRDLLLDREPRELDVVLGSSASSFETEATRFAQRLASLLQAVEGKRQDAEGERATSGDGQQQAAPAGAPTCVPSAADAGEAVRVSAHERFGTAAVVSRDARIDVAARRTESYAAPGALPHVRPGSAEQDLLRRDFTVNAIAVPLSGTLRGELRALPGALQDLRERRLRVIHDASFHDDPTRLLRLARYAARLSFAIEPHTRWLATQALAAGALQTVSPARIGAELRLLLAEQDPLAALAELRRLGVLQRLGELAVPTLATHRGGGAGGSSGSAGSGDAGGSSDAGGDGSALRLDERSLRAALALLPDDGRPDLLALASLLAGAPSAVSRALLDAWEYAAGERDLVLAAAGSAATLGRQLETVQRPSRIVRLLSRATPEAVTLAATSSSDGALALANAQAWLRELRHVELEITGEDLLSAGVRPGPELGRRLRHALELRLDGELAPGREAELAAALTDAELS